MVAPSWYQCARRLRRWKQQNTAEHSRTQHNEQEKNQLGSCTQLLHCNKNVHAYIYYLLIQYISYDSTCLLLLSLVSSHDVNNLVYHTQLRSCVLIWICRTTVDMSNNRDDHNVCRVTWRRFWPCTSRRIWIWWVGQMWGKQTFSFYTKFIGLLFVGPQLL